MNEAKERTPLNRWISNEITSGKFAELIGVPRHVGDEILGDVWNIKESEQQLAADNQRLREALTLMTDTLRVEPDHPRFIRVRNSKGLITLDIFTGRESSGNAYYVMDQFWSDILKAKEALSTPPPQSETPALKEKTVC